MINRIHLQYHGGVPNHVVVDPVIKAVNHVVADPVIKAVNHVVVDLVVKVLKNDNTR